MNRWSLGLVGRWWLFLLLGISTILVMGACAGEDVSSSSNAIVFGSNSSIDSANPPFSNTVVKVFVEGTTSVTGTGTLITPTVVLTAAHVISGADSNLSGTGSPDPGTGNFPLVGWGTNANADFVKIFTDGHPALLDSAEPITDPNNDQALVFLDNINLNRDAAILAAKNQLAQSQWAKLLGTQTARPVDWPKPTGIPFQAAGWGENPDNDRNVYTFLLGASFDYQGTIEREFSKQAVSIITHGDSGGPLFYTGSDLVRHVLGDLSALVSPGHIEPFAELWVPAGPNDNPWVGQHALDTAHSANWFAQHGYSGPGVRWVGEVDYLGDCNAGRDPDCDHWYNDVGHDNCPDVFNPDQADDNDDGIGDACDGKHCPCDDDGFDSDGDGVCQRLCPGQTGRVDNCPWVANADQHNTNIDFEIANGQDVLGDACDPVPSPVPATLSQISTSAPPCSQPPFNGQQCVPNPPPVNCISCQTTLQCCGGADTSRVVTQTIGAHVKHDTQPALTTPPPVGGLVVGVQNTHLRFCQEFTSLSLTIKCSDFATPTAILNDDQLAFDVAHFPALPWHRVTTRFAPSLKFPNPAPVFDQDVQNVNYGATIFTTDWQYPTDLSTWLTDLSNPFIPGCVSGGNPLGPTCLHGQWWVSASTDVGKTIDTVDGTQVGIHVTTPMDGNIADAITPMNAFTELLWCPVPNPYIKTDPPPAIGPIGWGPGRLVVLPHTPSLQLDNGAVTGDSRWLVATLNADLVGALQADGTVISAEDIPTSTGTVDCGGSQVDATLHGLMFSTTVSLFGAVEPSNAIRGTPFDALALSLDGTSLVATVQTTNGRLTATFFGAKPPGDPPVPRGGYAAAYSRWAGGAFVAGGQAISDSSVLHDVWFGTPDGKWLDVTPHASSGTSCSGCGLVREIGRVDAVTYSFADKKLWLIDELAAGKFTVVRLLRASPGGAIEQVATWPRTGLAESYFLSVDRDGAVLATFAKTNGQGFVVVRVAPTSATDVQASATYTDTNDKLLAAPSVSPVGYGFLVQHGKQLPRVARAPQLVPLVVAKAIDESLCQ